MSTNWKAVTCFGLAWPIAGLGFSAVNLGYLPSGLPQLAEVAGLFLAGTISGALLLAVLAGVRTPVGRRLKALGGWGVPAGVAATAPVERGLPAECEP